MIEDEAVVAIQGFGHLPLVRLIYAVSEDGFMASGPADDMRWTGKADKKAFRLLTSVGAVVAVGSTTYSMMPKLPGRLLVCLSTHKPFRLPTEPHEAHLSRMPLAVYASWSQTGWVAGGPTIIREAFRLGIVLEAFVTTCRGVFLAGQDNEQWKAPLLETLEMRPTASFPLDANTDLVRWGYLDYDEVMAEKKGQMQ